MLRAAAVHGPHHTAPHPITSPPQDKHIREDLRKLLPRDEGKLVEKPAEAAFRQRMCVAARAWLGWLGWLNGLGRVTAVVKGAVGHAAVLRWLGWITVGVMAGRVRGLPPGRGGPVGGRATT